MVEHAASHHDSKFDYIMIGSGPSECVEASRLVNDYGASLFVLLIEAGPRNNHPLLKMPAGFIKMIAGSQYWSFNETIAQPDLDARVHEVLQGHLELSAVADKAIDNMMGEL